MFNNFNNKPTRSLKDCVDNEHMLILKAEHVKIGDALKIRFEMLNFFIYLPDNFNGVSDVFLEYISENKNFILRKTTDEVGDLQLHLTYLSNE